jgi:hypothetical protein
MSIILLKKVNKTNLALIGISFIAIFLRLYRLNWGGVWYDEAFFLIVMSHIKEIFQNIYFLFYLCLSVFICGQMLFIG